MPQYREQLEQLRAAATVTGQRVGQAPASEAIEDESNDDDDGSETDEDDEDEDEDEDDSDSDSDSDVDTEAPVKGKATAKPATPQAATAAVVKKRKATEMEIADERRKMQESMLTNKKAKQYKCVTPC